MSKYDPQTPADTRAWELVAEITEYRLAHIRTAARELATRDLRENHPGTGTRRPRDVQWAIAVHNRGATLRVSYVDGTGSIQYASEAL